MLCLRITTIGSSAGIILTDETLATLKVGEGDTLYLTEEIDSIRRLTTYDPEFERQILPGSWPGCSRPTMTGVYGSTLRNLARRWRR